MKIPQVYSINKKRDLKRRNITKFSNLRYPTPAMDEDDKKELDFILNDYI